MPVAAGLPWLFWKLATFLKRPGATETELLQTTMTLVFTSTAAASCALGMWTVPQGDTVRGLLMYVGSLFALLAVWVLVQSKVSNLQVTVITTVAAAALSLTDVVLAARGDVRSWPLFLLVREYLLLMHADHARVRGLVAYASAWVVLIELERNFRFGAFDLPRVRNYERLRALVDCDRPPCSTADRDGMTAAVLSVLASYPLLAFAIGSVFSGALAAKLHERQLAATALDTTHSVVEALAVYDLDAAHNAVVKGTASLPADLVTCFETCISNLRLYHPYIPRELFPADPASPPPNAPHAAHAVSVTGGVPDSNVPGLAAPNAAIAFTDIRQSTALWEHSSPDDMRVALCTHNQLIRQGIAAFRGYEVKTVGDSFMVAFPKAWDAVQFGLDVQTQLARDGVWPEGLARPNMNDGFGVLTCRMGVHWGPVIIELNVLTSRYDYFGRVVNKAARVERQGCPGTVTVTDQVMQELQEKRSDLTDLACVTPYTGLRKGKGLIEPLRLTVLLPVGAKHLAGKAQEYATRRTEANEMAVTQSGVPLERPTSQFGQSLSSISSFSSNDSFASMCSPPTPAADTMAGIDARAIQRSSACVGVVKFDFCDPGSMGGGLPDERLDTLYQELVRTRGHLTSITCTTALVSWGVHGTCRQPINESVRFVMALHDCFRPRGAPDRPPFYAGLATGTLTSARLVASETQRFVTLVGPVVDLSTALCSAAAELRTCVLVASLSGAYADRFNANEFVRQYMRPVDEWAVMDDSEREVERPVEIAELRMISPSTLPPSPVPEPGSCGGAGWGIEYTLAMRGHDGGALARLSAAAPDDTVLATVAMNVRQGRHLPHALMQCRRRTPEEREATEMTLQIALREEAWM
eukprot:TRINITY_DN3818_c0_g2_i1.p1 TRINITY_DN3818_c0_g2~~TRINITY_DN3818_c0_g2_i1.p1  ORF type:complete len:868 (+),score=137.08 TRINITY_DN3818_c0_g2_i1:56-2659(+)